MMKTMRTVLATILLTLVLSGSAQAHKVTLFAYAEGGTIYTESFFPDGKSVEGGKVLVYDSQEKLLLEGVTDTRGLFSFPIPGVDDLTIVIDAAMGHKNSFKLKKAEVEAGK
jgi:nickel transport protein